VTGKPIFGIDVRVPNMLYAAIANARYSAAPQIIRRARSAASKACAKIVPLPNAVAVVGDSWWQAKRAVEPCQ
jgi:isoquinoline 1-oxidoreductase beta subunit